ncbi:MAG TPA: BON domain-containing protein [Dehalococcoidia bacterium]|nr:BON domain-containing protein [Dehalococcoidia bacterium]
MQSSRPLLRLGCPVRFRDRWQGRLAAFEIDEDWLVLNVVISRGLLRPVEVRLPFSIADAWDEAALSLDCTSDQAFGRELPPVAAPAMPLSAHTPVSPAEARLAGALVERSSRRVSRLLLSGGLLTREMRAVDAAAVTLEKGVVRLAAQMDTLPLYRPDPELLQALRDAIAVHPHLTADDRRALTLDVADGVAYLSGNVRSPQAEASVRQAAASVPGVREVRSAVVDDRTLETAVGRALEAAGMFRHGRLYVRAALGEVTLEGYISSAGPAADIVKAVAAVPGVRSAVDRMEVAAPAPASRSGPAAAAAGTTEV